MNDEWNNQYRRLQAVEELDAHNALLDLYSTLYKKKFRTEPIFPHTNAHNAQLKAFTKAVGIDKAYTLLQEYFRMDDKWFHTQQFSIDCLMKNLNRINVRAVREVQHRDKVEAEVIHPCDACGTMIRFVFSNSSDLVDKAVYCANCSGAGRIPKALTKNERRETVLRLGSAFPEIPNASSLAGDCGYGGESQE